MSVHALAWVFDLPAAAASPTERLVLLALADHANRDGEDIFPTNKRLQRMTGLSERTIRTTLRSLEGKRLLLQAGTWQPEGRPDRARPRFSLPLEERGAADAPRQQVPPEWGAGDAPEPTTGTDKPTPPPSHPKKKQPTATDTTAVTEALGPDPAAEEARDWPAEDDHEEGECPGLWTESYRSALPPHHEIPVRSTWLSAGKDLSAWRRTHPEPSTTQEGKEP